MPNKTVKERTRALRSHRTLVPTPLYFCCYAWQKVRTDPCCSHSSAAIFNEQIRQAIRQAVCTTSCACRWGGCVQISRSPDPHRGRASATDSRQLAKATSRIGSRAGAPCRKQSPRFLRNRASLSYLYIDGRRAEEPTTRMTFL
jgi:hypothetical protein